MTFSLIIPVYLNESSIEDLISAISEMSVSLSRNLEVVFVVDGSPDNSYQILREKLPYCQFPSQLLLHSRNFGSFAAIRSGLNAAKGNYFAVMAADCQEPIDLITTFFYHLEKDDADILLGTRETRKDPFLTRLASSVFWFLFRRLVMPEMPPGGVDVFGCNKIFRDELLNLQESNGSLIGLLFWLGFRRKIISYHRQARKHGKSAWTLRKKFNYFMDSIFSLSELPVRLLISTGLLGMSIAIFFGVVIAGLRISGQIQTTGYSAIMTTLLFFGGLNTFGLGIIGTYVWRAYSNTQKRPLAVVMRKEQMHSCK
jgi:glycosyltransferase involved in cell wall biosynthesis